MRQRKCAQASARGRCQLRVACSSFPGPALLAPTGTPESATHPLGVERASVASDRAGLHAHGAAIASEARAAGWSVSARRRLEPYPSAAFALGSCGDSPEGCRGQQERHQLHRARAPRHHRCRSGALASCATTSVSKPTKGGPLQGPLLRAPALLRAQQVMTGPATTSVWAPSPGWRHRKAPRKQSESGRAANRRLRSIPQEILITWPTTGDRDASCAGAGCGSLEPAGSRSSSGVRLNRAACPQHSSSDHTRGAPRVGRDSSRSGERDHDHRPPKRPCRRPVGRGDRLPLRSTSASALTGYQRQAQ